MTALLILSQFANMRPVAIWLLVVGAFFLFLLAKGIVWSARRLHNFISIGSEREELFVPGDPLEGEEAINEED